MKPGCVVSAFILLLTTLTVPAQEETLLIRFSPDASPLAMALGGLGTTLFGEADGLFFNPSLAAGLKTTTFQGQMLSSSLGGEWPVQVDGVEKRQYILDLQGDTQGAKSITLAHPRTIQSLTLALCGGWSRLMPYGMNGQISETWADLEYNTPLARTTRSFQGKGGLDAVWFGAALGDQQVWGFGIHHTFWIGEGVWTRRDVVDPDLSVIEDETISSSGRSDRLKSGFWTLGAYFRPHTQVLLTGSVQTRTKGDLIHTYMDGDLPEGAVAEEEYRAALVIPESLTFGMRIGPVHGTSLHAEYHTRFWSRALVADHLLGGLFPGLDAGLTQQRNEAHFSIGLSHELHLKGLMRCQLAAGLSWNQPLFTDESGDPLLIRGIHMGAKLIVGRHVAFAAALRSSRGEWARPGFYEPDQFNTFALTRSTLMLGIDFYPTGL